MYVHVGPDEMDLPDGESKMNDLVSLIRKAPARAWTRWRSQGGESILNNLESESDEKQIVPQQAGNAVDRNKQQQHQQLAQSAEQRQSVDSTTRTRAGNTVPNDKMAAVRK